MKKAQGKGVSNFASTAILKYAFLDLKLNRIYLNILSKKLKAVALYAKFRFKYEGEAKKML